LIEDMAEFPKIAVVEDLIFRVGSRQTHPLADWPPGGIPGFI
jgi:hypothetical protein